MRAIRDERCIAPPAGIRPNLKSNTRPLRIVLYEPAGRGGICHYTWELAEHLSKSCNDVLVLTTEGYELKNRPRNFRVHFLFRRSQLGRFVRFAWGRRRKSISSKGGAIKKEARLQSRLRYLKVVLLHLRVLGGFLLRRPDVVHFQWVGDKKVDLRFMAALRSLGILVVYTAHDVLPHEHSLPGDLESLARIYRLVDRIVVHAEANRIELLGEFNVDPRKVAVIPHGIYDFRLGRGSLSLADARQKLGIPVAKRVILFFGLIKPYKGLEYLISAHEKVAHHIPDAFLLIVGAIYEGDSEAHKHYVDLIANLRGRDDVRTVIEYVPFEDIATYLAAANVVALPYTHTSQSGVLLAAYGAARPVVVTDIGGMAEIVKAGETGLIVPPRNTEALAEALIEILEDPDRAAAMGLQGKRLGVDRYSWVQAAQATVAVYRTGLDERRARSSGNYRSQFHDSG